jgi:hypothetical protein
VNAPCNKVRKEILRLGLASDDVTIIKARTKKTGFDYKIGITELRLLLEIFEKGLHNVEGVMSGELFSDSEPNEFYSIAVVKLERLGLIQKSICADGMYEYYAYSITPDGLDYILANETEVKAAKNPKLKKKDVKSPAIDFDSFDDDIPF